MPPAGATPGTLCHSFRLSSVYRVPGRRRKVLSKLTMVFSPLLVLLFLLNTMGCSASYLRATVKDNPLDVVAREAQKDWSVDRIDSSTLRLTKSHVPASMLLLGYCASH